MSLSSTSSAPRADTVAAASYAGIRWIEAALLVGIMLITIALRLPALELPLERDEGAYAYVAWQWLQGGLPYRDAFDHKPPLIYLLYMPPLLTSLPAVWAIRVWATLLLLLNTVLVYIIGKRVWDSASALIAALIFGVAGSAFDLQGLILNTDHALVLPALIALWMAISFHKTQMQRYAVATGAAIAAAVLIKPVAILLVVAALFACRPNLKSLVRMIGGLAVGGAATALPVAAYFAFHGALNNLWFALVIYNSIYAVESRGRWEAGALADMLAPFVPLLLVAIGGAVLSLQRRSVTLPASRSGGSLIVVWAVAMLAAGLGSLRPYIHYYYPLLPFLALLAAPCVGWLWRSSEGHTLTQRLSTAIAPVLLLALLIVPFLRQNLSLIGTTPEQQAERLYGDVGKHYFAQALIVAAYVQEHTNPDDYIYIFAAEPEVYFLAERHASSRYIYDYPLTLLPEAPLELQRDLEARPPALIITYYGVRPDGFWETMRAQNFAKVAEIGGYEVFGTP